ncbi:MAG: replicative DNA helicase [Spirochaetia bacterium]|nr:replicative DNA helicase [Spirochaetia bacterium]
MASFENNSRILPNDEAAEKAILGSILLDNSILNELSSILQPRDFYKHGHQELYQTMLDFSNENSRNQIDIITLVDCLNKKNTLDICGGVSYLSSLTNEAPSSTTALLYANMIKKLSMRRRLITVSTSLKDDAFDLTQDISATIDKGENDLSSLASQGNVAGEYYSATSLLIDTITNIEKRAQEDGFTGYSTGFNDLDKRLSGGFKEQDYVIIGARPSIGKTAFALTMAINMLTKNYYRVGFLSLEMKATDLLERALTGISRVDFSHIRTGLLTESELAQIFDACDNLSKQKFFIQDTPNMQLNDIRSQARKMKREDDIQILFIDYIGLIQNTDNSVPRHEQIANISRTLKQLTRELNIPIIVLSQVGRQTDGQLPRLSDLRESGSIEQDADIVILLHRNNAEDVPIQKTEVLIAKNRNGETGKLELGFHRKIVRFEEISTDFNSNKQ